MMENTRREYNKRVGVHGRRPLARSPSRTPGLEPTASCVAPASGSGSSPAFGPL